MPDSFPRVLMKVEYAHAAREYLRKLRLEDFMESIPQATQRKISLVSLDLVHAHRPDIQHFNELLVQYPRPRRRKPGQVVPDNMVVIHTEPIEAEGSYDVPLQPVGPFWVLEYVSNSSRRKDAGESMRKYEYELKVPYYLMFTPDAQELLLYRHNGQKYVTVLPNDQERYPIPELELELGIRGGWVRYWFRGELLPLPADLQRALDEARREAAEARKEATEARNEATEARNEATEARKEAVTAVAAQKAMAKEIARLRELLKQQGQAPEQTPGADSSLEPHP